MQFIVFFVVVFSQMVLARVGVLICNSDEDCSEGYSCHDNSCMNCLKCSLLLRKGSDCVIDFNDCGECLPGYEEVLITDSSSAIKPCKPVRLKKKPDEQKCTGDSSCPADNYCHEHSCVKCFDCEFVNRLASGKRCAKELNDCGLCMKGFIEVSVTINSKNKPCERLFLSGLPKMYGAKIPEFLIYFMILVIPVVTLLVFAIFRRHKECKDYSIVKKSLCPKLPSAPPLHKMDAPQHIIQLVEEDCRAAFAVDRMQQAKVFKKPDASYYDHEEYPYDGNLGRSAQHTRSSWPPLNSAQPEQAECSTGISVEVSETDSLQPSIQVPVSAIPADEASNQQETEHPIEDGSNAQPAADNTCEGNKP